MKEWVFRNEDEEKVYLRVDEDILYIVPKRRGDEESTIPIGNIEKITYNLDGHGTRLNILGKFGKREFTCFSELSEETLRGLFPGMRVTEMEKEKLSLREKIYVALVLAALVGWIVLAFKVRPVAVAGLLLLFLALAIGTATGRNRWSDWFWTVYLGLSLWKFARGMTVMDWSQLILPSAIITTVLTVIMVLASRKRPKRAGRRLIALVLIVALIYAPLASIVLNALLPAKQRTAYQAREIENDDFGFAGRMRVSGYDGWLYKYSGSYTSYVGNNMVEYEVIDGILGIDYIVFTGDLEDLNRRGFAK